mgnify:CR=1 FL=1
MANSFSSIWRAIDTSSGVSGDQSLSTDTASVGDSGNLTLEAGLQRQVLAVGSGDWRDFTLSATAAIQCNKQILKEL